LAVCRKQGGKVLAKKKFTVNHCSSRFRGLVVRFKNSVFVVLTFFSHAVLAASSLSVSPASAFQGASLNLVISGSGFVEGKTQVEFGSSRVLVNSIRVVSATSVVVNVTLLAEPGSETISVSTGGTADRTSFEILPSALTNAQNGTVSYFAGPQRFLGSRDGRGTEARFFSPKGIWSDGTNLYVTDEVAHTLRRISIATADVVTIAGAPFQPGSLDGPGLDARFSGLKNVWGDGANLYIPEDCAVRRFSIATGEVARFAGDPQDCVVVDGPAGVGRFRRLDFITGDGTSLYLINGPACPDSPPVTPSFCIGRPLLPGFIRVVSIATGEVSSIPYPTPPALSGSLAAVVPVDAYLYTFWQSPPGTLTIGRINRTTQQHEFLFNSQNNCCGQFLPQPWFDGSANFYFIDGQSVRRLALTTGQLSTVVTLPPMVTGNQPAQVWGVGDNLYVTDYTAGIISRVHIQTGAVSIFAGQNSPPADEVKISVEWSDGEFIYGSSQHAVYKVRIADGQATALAGSRSENGFVDGIGDRARFPIITGMWGDGTHLYVLQGGYVSDDVLIGDAVRRINLATREVSTFATFQPLEFNPNLSNPFDIWGDGRFLYVTDVSRRGIYRVSIASREVTLFASGFGNIGAIWGDGRNLYVRDGCTIRRVDTITAGVTAFAGNNTECGHRDGPLNDARFSSVSDVWGNGSVLVVSDLRTIRLIDLNSGEVKTIAGNSAIIGTENGPALDARFLPPIRLTSDGENLYASDFSIRKISFASSVQEYKLSALGADYWKTSAAASMTAGYARIEAAPGNAAVDGVAIYSYRSNGVLVSEAAVPASDLIRDGRIYAEISELTRTGIALANPNEQDVTVSFYFTDVQGLSSETAAFVIPARNQIAAFLDEPPFNGGMNVRSFTFASTLPVGAVALRGYINERSEFLMTTLPVAPISSASTEAVVLPHFADGGGWRTQVLLVNPTDDSLSGTVETGGIYGYTIAPRSSVRIATPAADAMVRVGFVRVLPSAGSKAPVASTVFSFVQGGVTVTESGAPSMGTATSFRVYAEYAAAMKTGVGVVNTGGAAAAVRFQLLDLAGQPTAFAGSITLASNAHRSLFIDEIPGFRNLPASFRGMLVVSSNARISVLGLRERYNERGDFLISTTPAVADNARATVNERAFPHIVSGGGYSTEFLLINRGVASEGTIMLRTQSGADLPLL
jgi:IPT/TIG domain